MTAATLDRPASFDQATLPGLALANAWLNVSLASGDDKNWPVMWRSVLVETFDTGVQLVATDSYLLLCCYVPYPRHDLTPPPSLDESPTSSIIAVDRSGRMASLMRHVVKEAVAAEEAGDGYDVHISARSIESVSTPTLDSSLDRTRFIVQTEDERLSLPVYEANYPQWREMLTNRDDNPASAVGIPVDMLARLGKIRGVGSLAVHFDGPHGMARIETPGSESYLFGGLVPGRIDE